MVRSLIVLVVRSGVPQGSHLGPVLFILFVNDLCAKLKNCLFLFYADDLKIFNVIRSFNDAVILQENLDIVKNWCNEDR